MKHLHLVHLSFTALLLTPSLAHALEPPRAVEARRRPDVRREPARVSIIARDRAARRLWPELEEVLRGEPKVSLHHNSAFLLGLRREGATPQDLRGERQRHRRYHLDERAGAVMCRQRVDLLIVLSARDGRLIFEVFGTTERLFRGSVPTHPFPPGQAAAHLKRQLPYLLNQAWRRRNPRMYGTRTTVQGCLTHVQRVHNPPPRHYRTRRGDNTLQWDVLRFGHSRAGTTSKLDDERASWYETKLTLHLDGLTLLDGRFQLGLQAAASAGFSGFRFGTATLESKVAVRWFGRVFSAELAPGWREAWTGGDAQLPGRRIGHPIADLRLSWWADRDTFDISLIQSVGFPLRGPLLTSDRALWLRTGLESRALIDRDFGVVFRADVELTRQPGGGIQDALLWVITPGVFWRY